MIPYGRQEISSQDIAAVERVLKSDFLTQGPVVPRFEHAVRSKVCADHAVAATSATTALHLACKALGLGQGDVLWTSPNTFVASANCALYCGADIDFVDIDERTFNMCPNKLREKLETAHAENRVPKIVMPVHFAGQSCDMEKIFDLSQEFGFSIIEDASHAIGGKYKGDPIGNCRYSDITVFSFHPVKIITTGEGGMAVTNKVHLAEKMALLRSHGITRDKCCLSNCNEGAWYYEQVDLGFNYRMTEMQGALGLSQIVNLEEFVNKRHVLADSYYNLLQHLPLTLPFQDADNYSSFHLFPVQIKSDRVAKSRKDVYAELQERKIGVNVHYIPVHTQPHFRDLGFFAGQFPNSEKYYANALSIPLFHHMTEEQQKTVCEALGDALA